MKNEEKPSFILKCTQCSKLFRYESEKKRHEESHFPRFKCKVCAKKFSFISSLRRHEKQHDRNGNVKCEHCGGSFRDDILLKRHLDYKHKGSHKCIKCNAAYNSQQALRSHLKTHKPEAERKYRCSYNGCNKSFNFQHHLKHHAMTHVNMKQYYCDLCNKGFIQLHHFKTHLKTHDPSSWVYCNINGCEKKFSNEYARKRHEATCQMNIKEPLTTSVSSDFNSNCEGSVDSIQSIVDTGNAENTETLLGIGSSEINSKYNILDLSTKSKFDHRELKNLSLDDHADYALDNSEIPQINNYNTVSGERLSIGLENNCICAEITSEIEKPHNLIPTVEKTCDTVNNFEDNELNCEGCECVASCRAKNTNRTNSCLKRISLSNAMPPIHYVNGTVKIKDTFDIDIPVLNFSDRQTNVDKDNGKYVLKSCEAVLGKCIVSGNGAIGDGCLCAKMMVNEEVNAEEIDDITPQPNTYLRPNLFES